METPERNLKWILVISLIMFFVSTYTALITYPTLLYGFQSTSVTRDVWYYLRIISPLFLILTVGSSALWVAGFVRRWTYAVTVLFFAISILVLFIEGLRGFF